MASFESLEFGDMPPLKQVLKIRMRSGLLRRPRSCLVRLLDHWTTIGGGSAAIAANDLAGGGDCDHYEGVVWGPLHWRFWWPEGRSHAPLSSSFRIVAELSVAGSCKEEMGGKDRVWRLIGQSRVPLDLVGQDVPPVWVSRWEVVPADKSLVPRLL